MPERRLKAIHALREDYHTGCQTDSDMPRRARTEKCGRAWDQSQTILALEIVDE